MRNGSTTIIVNQSKGNQSGGSIGSTTDYTVQQQFYSDQGII